MRRPISFFLPALLAASVLAVGSVVSTGPVSAATIATTTTCSNGLDNAGGLGLICEVTIANVITPTGGSATVTVRECHGAAGDPTAACTTTTTVLAEPVTAVTQCNGSANGGGATLRCSVVVTNDFVGFSPTFAPTTVNQCVGSGDGDTSGCSPLTADLGAAITQCNGSANVGRWSA